MKHRETIFAYTLTPTSANVDVFKGGQEFISLLTNESTGGIPYTSISMYAIDPNLGRVEIQIRERRIPKYLIKKSSQTWNIEMYVMHLLK